MVNNLIKKLSFLIPVSRKKKKELELELDRKEKQIKELKKINKKKLEKIELIITKIAREQQKLTPYIYNNIYSNLEVQSNIRQIYLTELFKGIEKIEIPVGAVHEETGHENQVDMVYVIAIAKYLKCQNIFEFGTHFGQTTYYLSFASDNTTITTLDLPPEQGSYTGEYLGKYFKNSDREGFIKQILCDAKEFDTTPFQKQMDLIFIDGDHSYEGVKNDTEKAFEMLAPGGVIIWHDYAPKSPGIINFFAELTQTKPVFHLKKTCLLVYLDGVDPLSFQPHERKIKKDWLKPIKKELLLQGKEIL